MNDGTITFQWMIDEWGFPVSLAAILSAKNASHQLTEGDLGDFAALDNAWRCGDVDRLQNRRHRMICENFPIKSA